LYQALGIRGYECVRTDYRVGATTITIRPDPRDSRCSACGSRAMTHRGHAEHRFIALPVGTRKTFVVRCRRRTSEMTTQFIPEVALLPCTSATSIHNRRWTDPQSGIFGNSNDGFSE
jgi:hypothetical protein